MHCLHRSAGRRRATSDHEPRACDNAGSCIVYGDREVAGRTQRRRPGVEHQGLRRRDLVGIEPANDDHLVAQRDGDDAGQRHRQPQRQCGRRYREMRPGIRRRPARRRGDFRPRDGSGRGLWRLR